MSWQKELEQHLIAKKKVAVLGAGSELCGDDAAGMLVAAEIKKTGGGQSLFVSFGREHRSGEFLWCAAGVSAGSDSIG